MVLLSATYQPAGLLAWASLAHHTVVPIGVTFLWLVTRSRELIPIKAPIYWMLFPLVYGCYAIARGYFGCLLYTSPSPRDATLSRMPSSA